MKWAQMLVFASASVLLPVQVRPQTPIDKRVKLPKDGRAPSMVERCEIVTRGAGIDPPASTVHLRGISDHPKRCL